MNFLGPAVGGASSAVVTVGDVECGHATEALVGSRGWSEAVVPLALLDADVRDFVLLLLWLRGGALRGGGGGG